MRYNTAAGSQEGSPTRLPASQQQSCRSSLCQGAAPCSMLQLPRPSQRAATRAGIPQRCPWPKACCSFNKTYQGKIKPWSPLLTGRGWSNLQVINYKQFCLRALFHLSLHFYTRSFHAPGSRENGLWLWLAHVYSLLFSFVLSLPPPF